MLDKILNLFRKKSIEPNVQLSVSEMDKLDLDFGVKVIESDSSDYPIENGTIILNINGFEIKNIDDLKKIKNKIASVTIITNEGMRERILFR